MLAINLKNQCSELYRQSYYTLAYILTAVTMDTTVSSMYS